MRILEQITKDNEEKAIQIQKMEEISEKEDAYCAVLEYMIVKKELEFEEYRAQVL